MKLVGHRAEPQIAEHASGKLLAEGARFNETVARFSRVSIMPKGAYRYASHGDANRHEEECLVRAIAELATERKSVKY